MATYWADPYFASTTNGNGTTDTTTRNGTYAAPFKMTDLINFTGTVMTSVNGVSLANGDEIRIKGIAFNTLFPSSHTNTKAYAGYAGGVSWSNANLRFSHSSNQASSDLLTKNQATGIIAYEPSQVSEFLENCENDYLITDGYFSNVTAAQYGSNTASALRALNILLHKKYESQSYGSKITIRCLHENYYDNSTTVIGSQNPFFFILGNNSTMVIKLSAGWVSETTRGGVSLWVPQFQNSWKYVYFNGYSGTQCSVHLDIPELVIVAQKENNLTTNAYCNVQVPRMLEKKTTGGVDWSSYTMKMPDITGGFYELNLNIYMNNSCDVKWGKMAANTVNTSYGLHASCNYYYPFVCRQYLYANHVNGATSSNNSYSGINMHFGTTIQPYVNHHSSAYKYFFTGQAHQNFASLQFMPNSFVYFGNNSQGDFLLLGMEGTYGNDAGIVKEITVPTSVRNPSNANDAYHMSDFEPLYGPVVDSNVGGVFAKGIKAVNTAWTDISLMMQSNSLPANSVISLGILECGGSNYKTTNSKLVHIKTSSSILGNSQTTGLAPLFHFESNDYDGKPVGVLPSAGHSNLYTSSMLYYNDSDNNIVIQRTNAQATSSSSAVDYYFPLEVVAPTYTQASDSLKITVGLSRSNTTWTSNNYMYIYVMYRDSTQASGFRVESISQFAVTSLSTDTSSPTSKTHTLANLPTSGQDKITSALILVRFSYPSNETLDYTNLYRIHSSALEVV